MNYFDLFTLCCFIWFLITVCLKLSDSKHATLISVISAIVLIVFLISYAYLKTDAFKCRYNYSEIDYLIKPEYKTANELEKLRKEQEKLNQNQEKLIKLLEKNNK